MPSKIKDVVISEILKLHKQGLQDGEIIRNLGLSKSTVQHYLKNNRTKRKKSDRSRISDEIRGRILPLHAEGLDDQSIADILDIGKSTVSCVLVGKRVVNLKPRWQLTDGGYVICSICKDPKTPDKFRSPKFNGKEMSRPSFCKDCQRKKEAARLSNPAVFLRSRYNDLACRARKEDLPFTLTLDEMLEIYREQDGKCFYTGVQMHLSLRCEKDRTKFRQTLSFDKVIPGRGYVASNIVLCTYKANAVKQDLTLEEVQNWLPKWYAKLEKCGRLYLGVLNVA